METRKRVRVPDFKEKKRRGEKIAVLTAYDASMARLFDRAGIDAILVGDSLGNVIMGCETTLPVTLDVMVHHTRAVTRGAKRALVIADMPFLTYQVTIPEAVRNAGRLLQEGGAAAVKVEGGRPVFEIVERLVEIGIPVMGHLGLTPQSVHQLGGYRRQGQDERAVERIVEDGQVLVCYDVFGIGDGAVPPFVKQYAQVGELLLSAAAAYADDVREGRYPAHQPAAVATGTAEK